MAGGGGNMGGSNNRILPLYNFVENPRQIKCKIYSMVSPKCDTKLSLAFLFLFSIYRAATICKNSRKG